MILIYLISSEFAQYISIVFIYRLYFNYKIIRKDSKNEIKASIKTSIVAYKSLKNMMKNVYDTYPERLVMPGNILYIYRIKTLNSNQPVLNRICSTIFGCFKFCKNKKYEIHYDSRCATQDEFKKIVITNRMLLGEIYNLQFIFYYINQFIIYNFKLDHFPVSKIFKIY